MTASIPLAHVLLRNVTFQPDNSILLEYCIPSQDARENGVVLNHVMSIPYGQDYDDEIDAVHDAVLALIDDVLEDLPNLQPLRGTQPTIDEDEDEDDDDEDDDDEHGKQ